MVLVVLDKSILKSTLLVNENKLTRTVKKKAPPIENLGTLLDPVNIPAPSALPAKLRQVNEIVADIDLAALTAFVTPMKAEVGAYLVEVHKVDPTDSLEFWQVTHRLETLPAFLVAAKEAILFQPSSAAAERVFSMLAWMFQDNQESTLEDYKSTSVMLRYNSIQREKPQ